MGEDDLTGMRYRFQELEEEDKKKRSSLKRRNSKNLVGGSILMSLVMNESTGGEKILHQIDELLSVLRLALEDLLKISEELKCVTETEELYEAIGEFIEDEEFIDEDSLQECEDYEYEGCEPEYYECEGYEEQEWGENLPHGYEEIEYPQDDQTIYDPEQREIEKSIEEDMHIG